MTAEPEALFGGSVGLGLKDLVEARINSGLLGRWYVIARSADIPRGAIRALKALGRELVLWRAEDGTLGCLEDRCPHRGARLSQGVVRPNGIACRYHGVLVDSAGRIVEVPAMRECGLEGRHAAVNYHVHEASDGVFAYFPSKEHPEPGDLSLPPEITAPEHAHFLCTALWQCNYQYVVDNLADPMHGIYLHADSFTLAMGARQDTVDVTQTPQGFIIRRVAQQGVNLDWTEVVAQPHLFYSRVLIPYPKAGGPGPAMTVICFLTPVDESSCRIFFWRTRRVEGLAREAWRFMFRAKIEDRHWAVLEQDREMLSAIRKDARGHELLYQHDLGVARVRRYFAEEARRQVQAELAADGR
jgi:phenylpropionate dioxygenase-like ring-hydroxylating dioxygenase large terminal subunit